MSVSFRFFCDRAGHEAKSPASFLVPGLEILLSWRLSQMRETPGLLIAYRHPEDKRHQRHVALSICGRTGVIILRSF
jgi:hypothetical protein